jgi:hypothetical protein
MFLNKNYDMTGGDIEANCTVNSFEIVILLGSVICKGLSILLGNMA